MVDTNVELAREAARQGARVTCFQELFFGPYFCQVQDPRFFSLAEPVPSGPITELMRALARELNMVLVVPVFEEEQPGLYYNTAAVIDADGTYLGKYRKTHIPQVHGFFEKYYFRPGQPRLPGVPDRRWPHRGLHLLRPPLPRGLAGARPCRGRIVFNPSATSRSLSQYLWRLEQPAAAVANEYFVGAINRVGVEPLGDDNFYGGSYFVDPRGQLVGEAAPDDANAVVVRDLDMDVLVRGTPDLGLLPGPQPGRLRPPSRGLSRRSGAARPGGRRQMTKRSRHAHTYLRRNGRQPHRFATRRSPGGRRAHRGLGGARLRPRHLVRRGRPAHRRLRAACASRGGRRPHAHGAALRRHHILGHLRDG